MPHSRYQSGQKKNIQNVLLLSSSCWVLPILWIIIISLWIIHSLSSLPSIPSLYTNTLQDYGVKIYTLIGQCLRDHMECTCCSQSYLLLLVLRNSPYSTMSRRACLCHTLSHICFIYLHPVTNCCVPSVSFIAMSLEYEARQSIYYCVS